MPLNRLLLPQRQQREQEGQIFLQAQLLHRLMPTHRV